MYEQFSDPKDARHNILTLVHKGMPVIDRYGERIGSVEKVFLSAKSGEMADEDRGQVELTSQDLPEDDEFFQEYARETFEINEAVERLKEQLMQRGFFRIEGKGLAGRARYVMASQIEQLGNDQVRLRASKDELIQSIYQGDEENDQQ